MAISVHLLALFCVIYAELITSTKVTTKPGEIQGLHENGVSKFLGIPYATPMRVYEELPTMSKFNETYNATAFKPACPQDGWLLNYTMESLYGNLTKHLNIPTYFSEDCLYLNVYVPGSVNASKMLPVMVYIHGGGFQIGSGQIFNPTELVKTGNVIVVTFNYKLGALGFLSILNNSGLWDQTHALRWVQENVRAFGGNPDMVTIFGEGSGGVAVGLHVVSQQSRGLFKRAISMGGNAHQTEFLNMKPDNITHSFMETIGCSTAPDMHECFKNVTVKQILESQQNLRLRRRFFLPFIDGEFLPASPHHLFKTAQFAKVDYIIGFNNDAGTVYDTSLFMDLRNGISEEEYRQRVHEIAMVGFTTNHKAIFDTIIFEYRPTLSRDKYTENQIWLRQYMTILRDIIAAQSHGTELYHAGVGGKVYAYYFDEVPPFSEHSPLMLMAANGVEMAYVFGLLGNNSLSQRMMQAWSNFAMHGDPNLSTENGPWPLFNGTTRQFVQFSNDFNQSSKVQDMYPGNLRKRVPFWTELLPALQGATPSCEQSPPTDDDSGSVISLKQGLLRGERVKTKEYTWEQFMDIPYAEPPLGALRWKPPKPHRGWSGIRNSSKVFNKVCPQTLDGQPVYGGESEDCLNLDVFVPQGVKYVRYQKLPVMLFVHGGGYIVGTKSGYSGVVLAQSGVIVVSIQYRLGVLGFLSTGDEAAPGNYGLMDQNLAIRWTRENIEQFGGDPNEITIFGQSAGAFSVMFQMLSPKSKGLFKNVIAQSGSSFSPLALDRYNDSVKVTLAVARRENCPFDNYHLMVECLRKVPLKNITRFSITEYVTLPALRPVIDGDFLPTYPEVLYQENTTREFNVITGTVKDEGYTALGFGLASIQKTATNNPQALAAALKYTYGDLFSIQPVDKISEYLMKASNVLTDAYFSAGADRDAKLHSKYGGKTYRYFIKYKSSFSPLARGAPDWVQGAHGDDIAYVFGYSESLGGTPELTALSYYFTANNITFGEREFAFSRNIMTLWTNFARTGDPNKGLELGINWPLFTEEHPNILLLSENLTQPGHNPIITPSSAPDLLRPDKVAFWNELVPSLEFSTLPPCPGTTTRGTTDDKTVTDGGSAPATTEKDKATNIPNGDAPCKQEIGVLKLTGEQANIVLIVLGTVCAALVLVLLVTCCKLMSFKKKCNKLRASKAVYDNVAMN